MRRFLVLVCLVCFAVPFGASIAGCGSKTVTQFCNGGDSGPTVGQVASISLPQVYVTYGLSIDYAQVGPGLSASAVDCKGNSVSVRSFTYATTDMTFADINPFNGQVCGGTWNRNSGGGIADYTTCSAPNPLPTTANKTTPLIAFVTATANGAVSNTVPVYVHPVVTSVVIGTPTGTYPITGYSITATGTTFNTSVAPPPVNDSVVLSQFPTSTFFNNQTATVTASSAVTNTFSIANTFGKAAGAVALESGVATDMASCSATGDPSTNCCPSFNVLQTAPGYTGSRCLSQGEQAQLTARVYQNGTTNPADNITCRVGHVNFAGQNGSIFTVDQNGVLTAQQPGSTIVTANVSNSSTGGAAGFFSTCPPATISLTASTGGTGPISVPVNSSLPVTATVVDTRGVPIIGANLTYLSTTPTTISAAGGTVAPTFPGAATITAVCQPPTCNSAPFSQIGLFGNGKPVTSNGVVDITPGANATVLYIASTQSQYLLPIDFSNSVTGTPVKLTYPPNSMVITQDGSTIYLGSTTALMTVSAVTNALTSVSTAIPGTVLSVSPDGTSVVVTDPLRQTVSLVSNGSVTSSYGGIGTHAQWSPDSATVYITTTTNVLLEHSTFTGWNSTTTDETYNDLTVTVPSIGAYFAGTLTEGRSYCSSTTTTNTTSNPNVEGNAFYPLASTTAAPTDHVAATNDSNHILGVRALPAPVINDFGVSNLPKAQACPFTVAPTYFPTTVTTTPLTLIAPSLVSVNGIIPASNSALSFVTYTGTSGQLSLYVPAATGAGTLTYVKLAGAATAPVTGVFSTDNATFFAGTSGDNAVHRVTVTGTTAVDNPANVITPALPDANGNPAVPNLLVQRPRRSTS